MVNIKLWDPGNAQQSSSDATYVTVAMDVPSRRGLGDESDASLGAGQKIQFRRRRKKDGRKDNNNHRGDDGEEEEVEIVTWQPPAGPREEEIGKSSSWRPPFALSDEDRAGRALIVRNDAMTLSEDRRGRPQSAAEETMPPPRASESLTDRASTPPPSSSIPKTTALTVAHERSMTAPTNGASENDTTGVPPPSSSAMIVGGGLEPFTIPSVLSCTVVKSSPSEKVGLAFRKATGTVVVEKIVPGSAFDGTALRPGHECLSINGRRLRSARRAAEIVRESGEGLTLVASDAPRPPGTMYTMISLEGHDLRPRGSGGGSSTRGGGGGDATTIAGMHFRMKHGLVQLERADDGSPIRSTSMRAGDYVLAFNGNVLRSASDAVEVLESEAEAAASPDAVGFGTGAIPVLYFNMRQLRVSLVDKVIGDLWKKEWSDSYDECIVRGGRDGSVSSNSNSNDPLTLRFDEDEGLCELVIDTPHDDNDYGNNALTMRVPSDHPLHSVVETLNHGIACVLSAIRQGVELQAVAINKTGSSYGGTSSRSGDYDEYDDDSRNRNGEHGDYDYDNNNNKASDASATGSGGIMAELARLSGMYKDGLLSRDDFETIKAKLLDGARSNDGTGQSNGNVDRGGRIRLSNDNKDIAVAKFLATKKGR